MAYFLSLLFIPLLLPTIVFRKAAAQGSSTHKPKFITSLRLPLSPAVNRKRQSRRVRSPYSLQHSLVQQVDGEVVTGDGDDERLAEQYGAHGAARVLHVPLPEVQRQVHLPRVLCLHLVPVTRRERKSKLLHVVDMHNRVIAKRIIIIMKQAGG